MYRYLTILLAVTAFSRVERAEGANLPVSVQPARGDFGADLSFLKRFYCPPQQAGESNHFIDIWGDQDLRAFARSCGLTNNRALFVDSHGMGVPTAHGTGYVFYPHRRLLRSNEKNPYYSTADLARLL